VDRLADWLAEQRVSDVAMEATGQYWKPVWDVLAERGFELMLVNARHVKTVPGRKTDLWPTRRGWSSCWSTAFCGAVSCRRG
jgi:hypothetical protein